MMTDRMQTAIVIAIIIAMVVGFGILVFLIARNAGTPTYAVYKALPAGVNGSVDKSIGDSLLDGGNR